MELKKDDFFDLAKLGLGVGIILAIYWKNKQDHARWLAEQNQPVYSSQQFEVERPYRFRTVTEDSPVQEPPRQAQMELPPMPKEDIRAGLKYMLNSS